MAFNDIFSAKDQDKEGLDIIYIHGISTPGGLQEAEGWKTKIPEIAPPNSSLREFDLKTKLGDTFNAHSFLQKSSELLRDVFSLHERTKKNCRPIVFCCYSLGGLVLKRALWNANQSLAEFSEVIEFISGIIFLATPHFVEESVANAQALSRILRISSTEATRRPSEFEPLSLFISTCQQFDQLEMQIPILSCCESRKTTLQQSSWFPWRWAQYEILVDAKLSTTSILSEQVEVIDVDLNMVFEGMNIALQHKITKYLKEIFEETPERLKLDSKLLQNVQGLYRSSNHPFSSVGLLHRNHEPQPSNMVTLSRESSMNLGHTANSNGPTTPVSISKSMESTTSFLLIEDELSKILAPQHTEKLPCYLTAPFTDKNPYFFGRADTLRSIDKTFNCGPGEKALVPEGPVTFTVCGIGGVGKTQVAVSYMFTRRECFDAVFWLQADQTSKLDDTFNNIALQLGLEFSDDSMLNKGLVFKWLSQPNISEELHGVEKAGPKPTMASWLMIFDNVEDPALLKDYFPLNGRGYVLITRRNPTTNHEYPQLAQKQVELQSLQSPDAIGLFRSLVNTDEREDTSGVIDNIVQRLQNFPLAIVQMTAYINFHRMTLKDFLEKYEELGKRAELYSSPPTNAFSEHGYSKPLSTLWSLENLPEPCSRLLCVMALLDASCIQEKLLLKGMEGDRIHGYPSSRNEYEHALKQLIEMAIVSRNESQNTQFMIHPVVQEVVREQLGQKIGTLKDVFVKLTRRLHSMWPFVLLEKDGAYQKYGRRDRWEECKRLLPHLESLKSVFFSIQKVEDQSLLATKKFGRLIIEAAFYYHETSRFPQAQKLVESASKIRELCSGKEKNLMELSSAIYNVGGTLAAATNDRKNAIFLQEQCKEVEDELFQKTGRNTRRRAVAYSDLGRAKIANGIIDGVLDLFEESMNMRKELDNFDELQLYNPLRGMAMVHYLWGLSQKPDQSELLRSRNYLREALNARESRFGPDDKEGGRTGSLLYELGNVHYALGQISKSFDYHKRAYKQWSSTVGVSHKNTATASYKLACHYLMKGDQVDALKYFEKALKVYEISSLHKPELARTLFKLSELYTAKGESEKARSTLREAWRLRNGVVGGHELLEVDDLKEFHFDEIIEYWSR